MYASRQQLVRLSWNDLNDQLDKGARVVWMQRTIPSAGEDHFDVVLDTVADADITPGQVIHGFLSTVSPATLEKRMLEDDCITLPPGQAALKALGEMVKE